VPADTLAEQCPAKAFEPQEKEEKIRYFYLLPILGVIEW